MSTSAYVVRSPATVNPGGGVAANSWVRWPPVRACKSELGTSRSERELRLDMMNRIYRMGRKAFGAGKAGISPRTSTARSWSNRLGFWVGITEPTTCDYNAADQVATPASFSSHPLARVISFQPMMTRRAWGRISKRKGDSPRPSPSASRRHAGVDSIWMTLPVYVATSGNSTKEPS